MIGRISLAMRMRKTSAFECRGNHAIWGRKDTLGRKHDLIIKQLLGNGEGDPSAGARERGDGIKYKPANCKGTTEQVAGNLPARQRTKGGNTRATTKTGGRRRIDRFMLG